MKLVELKKMCSDLGIEPIPTRKRRNPDRLELSMQDCISAIQNYFINERKNNGTYDQSIEFMLQMKSPMLALLIKNMPEQTQKDIMDDNNTDWIYQEKIDGCHSGDTLIVLSDGSTKTIKEIVDNKLNVLVKSYNTKTGQVEVKRVVNWFDNGVKDNVIKISNGYCKKAIHVTDNHKYYTGDGYTDLKDTDIAYTLNYYSDIGFQALLGTLIGDTVISRDDRIKTTSVRLKTSCKASQEDYLDYKASIIGKDLIRVKRDFTSGMGFYQKQIISKDSYRWADLYDLRYNLFPTDPTSYFAKMGLPGLALLLMDDGSLSAGQINFHVNSWEPHQVEAFSNYLSSLNIPNTIQYEGSYLSGTYKEYPMIHLNQIPARRLSALLSNYIHPVMRYKLPEEFRNDYFFDISTEQAKAHITKVYINKSTDATDNTVYMSEHMYDIEVEDNHNYFVCSQAHWHSAFLVHNCRCIISYDAPNKQFHFYSRNLSEVDLLPIDYADKIVIPPLNESIINNMQSFVLDTEILPVNGEVTDERVRAANQLNVVSSILQYLPDESHYIQQTNPLKNIAFDCLMYDGQYLFDKPLKERQDYLHKLVKLLQLAGFRIELVPQKPDSMSKAEFYYSIIDNGGEGVVAKDINATYDILGKRDGRWVKLKRSVQETMIRAGQDTFDAFVSGFTLGNPGTKNENKIGAIIFSVYLTDDDGNMLYHENGDPMIHEIAQIAGIPDELRDMLTWYDDQGNVMMNPRFMNQVAELNGQDISSRDMKIMHATISQWRLDRSFNTCLVKKSLLESMVL